MIVHVILFRPRPEIGDAQRRALLETFSTALRDISAVRRARIGRRVLHGRGYEDRMSADYSHAALLEFDDIAGLQTYLRHPAHVELGSRFFEVCEETLIYDYDVTGNVEGDAASGL